MNINLIKNANFERDSNRDGLADNWNSVGSQKVDVSFGIDTKGKRSQRIIILSQASETGRFFGIASDRFVLENKGNIELRVLLKAQNVSMFHILFFFYDVQSRPISTSLIPNPLETLDESDAWNWDKGYNSLPLAWRSGSWDWKQWNSVLSIPPDAVKAEVNFWFRHSGTLWVSNVFAGIKRKNGR